MKLRLLIICLPIVILSLATPVYAGNSIFSYYGAPCQNYGNDVYGMTMGDVGVADIYRKNTGYGNPAMLGNNPQTLFSTGLMFGWTGYKSNYNGIEKSYRDNSLDFPFFSLAIPYRSHHFGFEVNSLSSGVAKNQITSTIDSVTITEVQSIDNYQYRADFLYAYSLKNYNFGIGFNYYFGHEIRRFYQNTGYGVFNTSEKLERNYKNPTATIGFTANFKSTAIGAYFTKGCTLEGESTISTIHSTDTTDGYKHTIPNHFALGLTRKLMQDYKLSTDVQIDLWKMEDDPIYVNDSYKVGIGLAEEPTEGTKKTFFGQMPKRIGFSYRTLPFEANGTVDETSFSGGVTLPLKQSDNRLDLGFQYTMRGNIDNNNLQDHAFMFLIGITGFDVLSGQPTRTKPREIPKVEELSE